MVAQFRYYAEVKDEHGNNIVEPFNIISLDVRPAFHDWAHGWGVHAPNYPMMRRDGELTMKCFVTENILNALMPNFDEGVIYRPQRREIHIKNQFGGQQPRSYNVFKNCFMTNFNWTAVEANVIGEIVEAEMVWRYQGIQTILNLPVEMGGEDENDNATIEFIDSNDMWAQVAAGGPFYDNPSREISIAPADWRQFGF